MSYDITGKTILITGANRGIGKAIAEGFLENGASKVYAAVRTTASAASLVDRYGDRVVPIHLDLADGDSITAAAQVASDVDVVINNAGVLKTATPLDADAASALAFEMDVNVYGLIRMAHAFGPVLKANGGGVFAQLNSVVSLKAFSVFGTYSASKAAAYSITQSLRELMAPDGIHVLSVHPGPIATDMGTEAGLADVAEPASLVAEAMIEGLRAGVFHVFPDTLAKQIGGAYAGFAEAVVEAEMNEG